MRKTVLGFAIATCVAAPTVVAQSHGGGHGNSGIAGGGASMGGQDIRASIGSDTAARAQMQRQATVEERTRLGADQSAAMRAGAGTDASAFGQDTAARAEMQQDADVETRKQFGDQQSDAAKARSDNGASDDGTSEDDGSN